MSLEQDAERGLRTQKGMCPSPGSPHPSSATSVQGAPWGEGEGVWGLRLRGGVSGTVGRGLCAPVVGVGVGWRARPRPALAELGGGLGSTVETGDEGCCRSSPGAGLGAPRSRPGVARAGGDLARGGPGVPARSAGGGRGRTMAGSGAPRFVRRAAQTAASSGRHGDGPRRLRAPRGLQAGPRAALPGGGSRPRR